MTFALLSAASIGPLIILALLIILVIALVAANVVIVPQASAFIV